MLGCQGREVAHSGVKGSGGGEIGLVSGELAEPGEHRAHVCVVAQDVEGQGLEPARLSGGGAQRGGASSCTPVR
jgi:hypothetical protein